MFSLPLYLRNGFGIGVDLASFRLSVFDVDDFIRHIFKRGVVSDDDYRLMLGFTHIVKKLQYLFARLVIQCSRRLVAQ